MNTPLRLERPQLLTAMVLERIRLAAGARADERDLLSVSGGRHSPHGMIYLRAAAVWGLILLLAILNGALREALLLPWFGDPVAHLVSGMLLVACILVVAYLLVPRVGARSVRQLVSIGVCWFALTLAFEFGFGLLVQGRSWSDLLAAYTFRNGNIWPVVLWVTLAAPWLVGRRNLR